jgi:DNA-binding beta-propeller fold protein YncE
LHSKRLAGPAASTGYLVVDIREGASSGGYALINPVDGEPVGHGGVINVDDFVINGQNLYADGNGGVTSVLTLDGRSIQNTYVVPDATKIVVSPDGQRAYVLTSKNSVIVLDITKDATQAVVGNITVPQGSTDIAISPDGTHLYVTSDIRDGDTVTVISISPAEAPDEPAPSSVL